jgi:hypothetical protein
MAMKTLGLGLLLAAAGVGGYFLLRSGPDAGPAAPTPGGVAPAGAGNQQPPVEPRVAKFQYRADEATVPREDRVLLPDGTWAMALNGVKNPPRMDWPSEIPYAPIVEMITDPKGQQWYKHADGSQSTMVMTWRSDLGREDAVTQVANPAPVVEQQPPAGPLMPNPGRRN